MEKSDKEYLFEQFQLTKIGSLNFTNTSNFEKVRALTQGCLIRKKKKLYKSEKAFVEDLQRIFQFDPESANVVFQSFNEIKYQYSENQPDKCYIKVQCRKCGLFKMPNKFCFKCENAHYCSEVCEFNIKLTHEKQQCKIINYPKIQTSILIQVHFGTDLGHNIEIYFQHFGRAYSLTRGKQIINSTYEYFRKIANSDKQVLRLTNRRGFLQQKLSKYKIQTKDGDKNIVFSYRNEHSYATGDLKVDLEDIDALKRIYQQNLLLEEIQLYLLSEGGIMFNCAQEIHNNHVHWVYLFRMP